VWDWVRTVLASLLGGLIAGSFTLLGQSRQAKTDRARLALELEANDHAANDRWERDRRAAARADSLDKAKDLFDRFVRLASDIRYSPHRKFYTPGGDTWEDENWGGIWTPEVSNSIDVASRLLVDDEGNAPSVSDRTIPDRCTACGLEFRPRHMSPSSSHP